LHWKSGHKKIGCKRKGGDVDFCAVQNIEHHDADAYRQRA
jgi:hypothetical protein